MPPARSGATPSLGFLSPAPAPGLVLVVVLCRWLVGGAHCPAVLAASSVSASSMSASASASASAFGCALR